MRLFVALSPPAAVIDHADSAVARVRARHPELRWVPAHRWHLTLAFYGEVADDDLDGVRGRITRAVRGKAAMELSFRGAGFFARRAVWLGIVGDVAGLQALAREVATERRPFRPHLTVARMRGTTDPEPAVAELADYEGPPWVADSVHLVRSQLGPSPTYADMATWSLDRRS
ncbi:MAG TPA: RNA 2',3'-cyclic phosphodiesterase [Actinomycetes bacterium]